jgi:hypothetical protein
MGKLIDEYVEELEKTPNIQIEEEEVDGNLTNEDLLFWKVFDQAIIRFVKENYPNWVISDMEKFCYDFCLKFPVRESELKIRVLKLQRKGWRY